MRQHDTISRCGSQDGLNVPQFRAMIELIRAHVGSDPVLAEFSAHLGHALVSLDAATELALEVMHEVEAERASLLSAGVPALPEAY